VHTADPSDAESEVGGGDGAGGLIVHPIRAAVEVGEVRKPGMIWES